MKDALRALPKGEHALEIAYDGAIGRIEGQPTTCLERAKKVIGWILYAQRPLTGLELQHALSVVPEDDELDQENFLDVNEMITVCAGLVVMDKGSNVIRLVRYTTQEYLHTKREPGYPMPKQISPHPA